MIYYNVKPQYQGYARKVSVHGRIRQDGLLVGNELYTEKEMESIANDRSWFEKVEVSKRNVCWLWGARIAPCSDSWKIEDYGKRGGIQQLAVRWA